MDTWRSAGLTIDTTIELEKGQDAADFAHALRAKVSEFTKHEFKGRLYVESGDNILSEWGVKMGNEIEFAWLLNGDLEDEWMVSIKPKTE